MASLQVLLKNLFFPPLAFVESQKGLILTTSQIQVIHVGGKSSYLKVQGGDWHNRVLAFYVVHPGPIPSTSNGPLSL